MQSKKTPLTPQEIRRYTIRFWKFVIGGVAFVIILLLSIGLGLFGRLPSFRDLENPKSNSASEILGQNNALLGKYYLENRSPVTYKMISPNVINALVATEDKRFYEHSGIDFSRTFTMILYTLVGKRQGGSTITQQLALNLFNKEGRADSKMKRIIQKLQEWILAVKLERSYTKEEIITMYLNTVDFGYYNTYGINSASRTYFNTSPDKLRPEQAAVLIGMLKGPSIYSPVRHPENAAARRNVILGLMAEQGFIGETEAEALKQRPLGINLHPQEDNIGPAPYFRAVLKKEIQKLMEERHLVKADDTPYDLDRDGLRIYTTINLTMQQYAEEAQREYLKNLQQQFNQQWNGQDPFKRPDFRKMLDVAVVRSQRYAELKASGLSDEAIFADFRKPIMMKIFTWRGARDTMMRPVDSIKYYKLMLRNAMMSMEPDSGYIRAWVGGNDFRFIKRDQVKIGKRQVGSTAKPFTYAVAIGPTYGISPCALVPNEPITIDDGYGQSWTPKAYNPVPGPLTLKRALAMSQNWVTARVMNMVGPTAVSTLIKKMGITSDVPAYASICLGTFDASLYDMVGAYSAFVNHGIWTEPVYLLRIEDRNGNVIYRNETKIHQVLDESTAYAMVDMLKGVVQNGTGARLGWEYGLTNPIGGKTGTTQQNSDGWFIGVTPKLVTGVWTGFEERTVHFASTTQGEGSKSAMPVFAGYMKRVYNNPSLHYPKTDFERPANMNITLDCGAYASPGADSAAAVKNTKIKF